MDKPVSKNIEEAIIPKKKSRRNIHYGLYILSLFIIGFTVLAFLAWKNPYFSIDLIVTRFIQNISLPGFDPAMRLLTHIGNNPYAPIMSAACVLFFLVIKRKQEALLLVISVGGATGLSLVLKHLVGRPRPPQALLTNFPGALKDASFPSGHVLFYIGLFGCLLFLIHTRLKNSLLRSVIIVLGVILLILIGVSRIYVGAHWFSDVLGACLIGLSWLYIVIKIYYRYLTPSAKV